MSTKIGYSLPDRDPDMIVIKKGDLGGYVLEMVVGSDRKVAGFANVNGVFAYMAALLTIGQLPVGQPAAEAAPTALDAILAKKRPGRKPGSKNKAKTAAAAAPVANGADIAEVVPSSVETVVAEAELVA